MPDHVVPEINVGPMTRRRLHDLVWSIPVHRLAPHFRCTGTWIKKPRVDAGIPTPHRGHWARLAAGKRSAIRALQRNLDPDEVVLTL